MPEMKLPDIRPAQRPASRGSAAQSLRAQSMRGASVAGSRAGDETRSVRSGASWHQGSEASASPSVVNLQKRQSLRGALVDKLLAKYYPGIANSKTEALIHSEVDALMNKGRVTEEDLRTAEAKIRQQSNSEIAYIATNPFKRVINHKSEGEDAWAKMVDARAAKGMQKEKEKAAVKLQKQEEFRTTLAEQVKEAESRRMSLQLAKQEEAQKIAIDSQEYQKQQDQKLREQQRKIEKIKVERDEMMAALKKRRQEAKAAEIAEGKAAIEKLRLQQIEEARKVKQLKQQQLEKMARWKKENELNLAEKERKRQAQIEAEQAMLAKANQDLDAAAAKRQKEFEELMEKMKFKGKIGEALGADRDAQIREDEARMIKHQAEFAERVERELNAKKEKIEQAKIDMRKSLDKQVKDKKARNVRETAEREKQARIDAAKAAEAIREVERKEAAKRNTMAAYRLQLEDQVRAAVRERPGRERKMSQFEEQMNSTEAKMPGL